MSQTRRLAAILTADVAGYSRLIGRTRAISYKPSGRYGPSRDYVNQIGLESDEGSERIKAAYGVIYERLVALKNKYDPTNLFRHNQNIKPTV